MNPKALIPERSKKRLIEVCFLPEAHVWRSDTHHTAGVSVRTRQTYDDGTTREVWECVHFDSGSRELEPYVRAVAGLVRLLRADAVAVLMQRDWGKDVMVSGYSGD